MGKLDKRSESMHDGGSITDELRRFIEDPLLGYAPQDQHIEILTEIADRIDAEHEAQLNDAFETRNSDENLESDGWVRLPVDADGEPIHVGDGIEIIGGEDGVAVAIELCEDGGWNVSMRPTGWDTPTMFAAESVRHYHAPTVEDVLRDMHAELDEVTALYVGEAIDSDERDRDETRIFAEYAKRLTLAGDAE